MLLSDFLPCEDSWEACYLLHYTSCKLTGLEPVTKADLTLAPTLPTELQFTLVVPVGFEPTTKRL